jgi:hypothetical protein
MKFVNDGFRLATAWKDAVAKEATILGLWDWLRKHHPTEIIDDDPPGPPLSLWMTNVEKRLGELEQKQTSPFTITALIERRIHDALTRAAGALTP